MTLDDAITKLTKARKRLEAEQGRIARRNARAAVCTAIRQVRAALDTDYPVDRKPRVVRVQMTAFAKERRKRQKLRSPLVKAISTEMAAEFMAAGLPVTRGSLGTVPGWFVSAWIVDAHKRLGMTPQAIAPAVRSRREHAKITTALRLRSQGATS